MSQTPAVAILMGSSSDFPIMKGAKAALEELGIAVETKVLSAHRTPDETAEYVRTAPARGVRVFIGGAGGAAHLPGVIAASTTLPVIGVPVAIEPLRGQDSLLSIVQMPRGIPVATVGIDNAFNAGLLAAQILATADPEGDIAKRLKDYRKQMREKVLGDAANRVDPDPVGIGTKPPINDRNLL